MAFFFQLVKRLSPPTNLIKIFHIATICFLLTILSQLSAQQLPIFTQYNEYRGIVNPAFVPYEMFEENYRTSMGVAYRDQWLNIPDRPRTAALRYEQLNNNDRGIKLLYGGYFIHDQIGVFQTSDLKGRVSAQIKTRDDHDGKTVFSSGLLLGASRLQVSLADIAFVDGDPILFKENSSAVVPDVGIGFSVYNQFRNKDYFQIGIAAPQLLNYNKEFSNGEKSYDIRRVPHYYLTTSYYKSLVGNAHLEFSGWIKKVQNVPLNYDVMLRYKFDQRMWLGCGVNNSGIIHTEIGMNHHTSTGQRFKVGYSFNPTFHRHVIIFGNVHELNLSYYIK